jgi:protein SCO1/2
MSTPNERHRFPVGTLLLAGLLAALMLLTYLLLRPPSPPDELRGMLRSEFTPLAPFHLNSRSHGPIDREQLLGKWTLVSFGYRACGDPCANTLHELAAFHRLLDDSGGDDAARLQVLFVSVDPARDSEEALAGYVAYFDPRFIGATAGQAAVERFARQFGAAFVDQAKTAPEQYAVSHSDEVFLVDPHARMVATFTPPLYAATLLAQFESLAGYYGANG